MTKHGIDSGSDYPDDQQPVNIPPTDMGTVSAIDNLINMSFVGYMSELRKADINDYKSSINNLESIISEYLSPFVLIGYLPNGDPVEISNISNKRDEEAILERIRKTFIRHTNNI